MSAVAGVLAGVVAAAGAVALYRLAGRRVRAARAAFFDPSRRAGEKRDAVLDFERDPETGVYRGK